MNTRRVKSLVRACVVSALMGAATGRSAVQISGTVSGTGGSPPLSNIYVEAYVDAGESWDWAGLAVTDGNGDYSFSDLEPGTYRVFFVGAGSTYSREWYDNALIDSNATALILAEGTHRRNVNASLDFAGSVTGRVTAVVGGIGLANIEVRAWRFNGADWDYILNTYTSPDGTYSVAPLPAGLYRVRFEDPGGTYEAQWYDRQWLETAAATLTVAIAATVSNVDALLELLGASVAGAITKWDGVTPLPGIHVGVYRDVGGSWTPVDSETTDSLGEYRAAGLNAGTYKIQFEDPAGRYLTQWFTNAANEGSATPLVLGATQGVPGVSAALALDLQPPTITGIRLTGPQTIQFLVSGMSGVTYWTQSSADLAGQPWTNTGPSSFSTLVTNTFTVPGTNAHHFWRIRMGE